jgi:hypothetical protein
VDRYDFGSSPELLLKPSIATSGVYGKKKKKSGVMCDRDERASVNLDPSENHNYHLWMESYYDSVDDEEDDEDEDEEGVLEYDPVIRVVDPSVLTSLKHPKKAVKHDYSD